VNSSLEIAGHARSSGIVRCHTKAISMGKRKQKNIPAMRFKKGMGRWRKMHGADEAVRTPSDMGRAHLLTAATGRQPLDKPRRIQPMRAF
jgi:hypothetical protein